MVTLFLMASEGFHETSRNLLENYMLDCYVFHLCPKSHVYTDFPPHPLPLWSSFPALSKLLSPGLKTLFCLK